VFNPLRDMDFTLENTNFSRQNILAKTGAFAKAQVDASQSNLVGLFG